MAFLYCRLPIEEEEWMLSISLTVSWWICVILEITKYMCACVDLDSEHSLSHECFRVMQFKQHKVLVYFTTVDGLLRNTDKLSYSIW